MEAIGEFPFVEQLPKREKSKVAKLWDVLAEASALTEEKGMLLPSRFAAKLLGISQARVDQLMDAGKLERVELDGHPFVTENSVVAFAKTERKAGRPVKAPKTFSETYAVSKAFVQGK